MSNNIISRDAPFRWIFGRCFNQAIPIPRKTLFMMDSLDAWSCRECPADDETIGYDGTNPCVYKKKQVIEDQGGGLRLLNKRVEEDLYPTIPDWVKKMRIGNGSELKIHQIAGGLKCKELFEPPFMLTYVADLIYVNYLLTSVWMVNQYGTEIATVEPDGFETTGQDGLFYALHQGGRGYANRWMDISPMKPFRPKGLHKQRLCIYPDHISWFLDEIKIKEHRVLADFTYTLLLTSIPQQNFTKDSSFYVKSLVVSRI